jgi:hypothetical protein
MTIENLTPSPNDLSYESNCQDLAAEVAASLGVKIHPDIPKVFWSLAIVTVLARKIITLEKEMYKLKQRLS